MGEAIKESGGTKSTPNARESPQRMSHRFDVLSDGAIYDIFRMRRKTIAILEMMKNMIEEGKPEEVADILEGKRDLLKRAMIISMMAKGKGAEEIAEKWVEIREAIAKKSEETTVLFAWDISNFWGCFFDEVMRSLPSPEWRNLAADLEPVETTVFEDKQLRTMGRKVIGRKFITHSVNVLLAKGEEETKKAWQGDPKLIPSVVKILTLLYLEEAFEKLPEMGIKVSELFNESEIRRINKAIEEGIKHVKNRIAAFEEKPELKEIHHYEWILLKHLMEKGVGNLENSLKKAFET